MKKTVKHIFLITALFFLFEFIYSPLMHNHAPDIYDHYNCPAYILSVTFVSFALTFFVAVKLFPPFRETLAVAKATDKPSADKFEIYSLRAPPF